MTKLGVSQASRGQFGYRPDVPYGSRHARRRPFGVTLLAVLYLLAAAWFLRALLLLLLFPRQVLTGDVNWYVERDRVPGTDAFSIALVILLAVIAAGGLLWRTNWARRLSLMLYGLVIAVAFGGSIGYLAGRDLSLMRSISIPGLVTALVAAAAVYYLCRPEVRSAFEE